MPFDAEQTGLVENADQMIERLDQIAQISGKKAKDDAVADLIRSDFALSVVKAAYDPFVTYGVSKIEADPYGAPVSIKSDGFWELLEALALRKLTGAAAKQAIANLMAGHSEASVELLQRIVKKDLRASFTADTVNRVRPGTIFVFKCMLAKPYDAKKTKFPAIIQEKYDGVRALAIVDRDESGEIKATIHTRTGKEITSLPHVQKILAQPHFVGGVFDGEVVDGEFNQTSGNVRRKSKSADTATFVVFDAIPLKTFPTCSKTYADRIVMLKHIFSRMEQNSAVILAENQWAEDHDEVQAFADEIMARGGEGAMVKDPDAGYHGKRHIAWQKVKGELSFDCPIIGFEEGTGKFEGNLGALVVDFNGVHVKTSGMSDAQRTEFWQNQDEYLGRLVEIKCHELTPDKSMRHPRFIRLRDDKPVEDGVGC